MPPSSETSAQSSISPAAFKRAWNIVTWSGMLGSAYFILCIYGSPRTKFLTEIKATAFDFGLISGLAAFALIFQIAGGILTNRLKRRRPAFFCLAISYRLVFFGVVLAPFLFGGERLRIAWIIFVLFCHDMIGQTMAPLWMSWMADLLPKETMTRHWASRQRFITMGNIFLAVIVGLSFNYFEKSGQVITGFVIMASVGVVLGVTEILMYLGVPEPPNERIEDGDWIKALTQPLRDREFRPFLYFMGYFHFAVYTSAPFFGLYLIGSMKLSVLTVQMLGIFSSLGFALSSRYWGLLCDTYGYKPALQILSEAKTFTPLAFVFAPQEARFAFPFYAIVFFFDGIINAGMSLAMQGVLMRSTPRRNRTMYIASANFLALGLMAALSPVLSGRLIDFLNYYGAWHVGAYHFTGFHAVFAISVVLRFGVFKLASRIREANAVPLKTVLGQLRTVDFLRVTACVYRLHDSANEGRRLEAARRLGELKNPMAISELIRALQDESLAVREAAAVALGRIGTAEATEPLSKALFDPASGIHSPAARALGLIGGPQSLKALLGNLVNRGSRALGETIDSLVQIGDSAAILPLICLFHEVQDKDLRQRIATALGKLSQTESVEEVVSLLYG